MIRTLIFLLLLVGSFAVPFFALSDTGKAIMGKVTGSSEETNGAALYMDQMLGPDMNDVPRLLPAQLDRSRLPSELAPIKPLAEVLDFEITPPWVLGNWPNVTTGLRDGDLFGYRVPLVTGTAEDAITGSLTYYFTPAQRLERIQLRGDTGDARALVEIVTTRFGMQRQISGEGEYLYRQVADKQTVGELRATTRRVVRSAAPYQRFEISLTLSRPDEPSGWFRF
jgi:hypothetical protein